MAIMAPHVNDRPTRIIYSGNSYHVLTLSNEELLYEAFHLLENNYKAGAASNGETDKMVRTTDSKNGPQQE
jgi:hypothetical protein